MKIALVSLNQKWEDKYSNLASCETLIRKASAFQPDLIVFPEMTLTGFSMNTRETAEMADTSQSVEAFRVLAKDFGVGLIIGVVFNRDKKSGNCAIFINRTGEVLATYQKIHPFSFSGEDEFFDAGHEISQVNFESLSIGLTICYDLRFPELYSALAVGSDLIVNIANWPAIRLEHWVTLLKARAIENQIFIVGVNRSGKDDKGLEYVKSSMIIKPNGDMLGPLHSDEEIDIFDIDINFTIDLKQRFSTTQDRKPKFYKSIL
jgi:predicted amidohydrolase